MIPGGLEHNTSESVPKFVKCLNIDLEDVGKLSHFTFTNQ